MMMTEITGPNKERLERSVIFQQWLRRLSRNNADIQIIEEIQSFWSKDTGELAYALFSVKSFDREGRERKNLVFFRRNAVAVFIVLRDEKTAHEKYVVLVEQLRIAGGEELLEIPAGSIEGGDDPLQTIVREVKEEVGLSIPAEGFKFLGQFYLSPGACNEQIRLFSCEKVLNKNEIKALEGKPTGTPGENTTVRLFRLENFAELPIRDAKTVLAYALYLKSKQ